MTKANIAIAVHIYYPELWDEISAYLSKINQPFDLFVTTTNEHQLEITSAIQTHFPNVIIKTVASQGMDILPFLSLIPEFVEAKYEAVCKLHTKKGDAELGAIWRQTLLHSLIGSDQTIELVTGAFSGNHQVGIVGTGAFYLSAQKNRQTDNTVFLQRLYQQLKFTSPPDDWGFFVGNMFWVKPEILMPLSLVVNEHSNWFKTSSNSQQDGNIEHALERVIGLIPLQTKQLIGYLLPKIGSKQDYALHVVNNVMAQNKIGQSYINPLLQQYQTLEQDRRLLLRTGLFSHSDYLKQFPDLSGIHADLPSHYLLIGRFQGATPHPDFDPIIYRQLHQQQLVNDEDCFLHYVRHGAVKNLLLRKTNEQQQTDIPSFRYRVLNTALINWSTEKYKQRDVNKVSIIIPVFDQPLLTKACIESLYQFTQPLERFEVVVVDNGSQVETQQLLQSFSEQYTNLSVLRNEENLNFALGCNLGFAASMGQQIIFLNNDTQVTENWLEPLLEPLAREDISAVQPRLLYPDGTVQCIGIVFSDKSTLGYPIYQGMKPEKPWISRSRKFQAVTGACMALRASDFIQVGGFDPIYINGQEDVDLCLRINRLLESEAWYSAESKVVHFESSSLNRGEYINFNRYQFADRWCYTKLERANNIFVVDGFFVTTWHGDQKNCYISIFQPHLEHLNSIDIAVSSSSIYESSSIINKVDFSDSNEEEIFLDGLSEGLTYYFSLFKCFSREEVDKLIHLFLDIYDVEFIVQCYQFALGRSPEKHEKDHYFQFKKINFFDQVFSCKEFKTHQNYLSIINPEKKVFRFCFESEASISAPIRLDTSKKPLISVIIPVYGKIEYTLMCLRSIMNHQSDLPYEIIVVDDKSPDDTLIKLTRVRGIRIVKNKKNSGFIISCNNGATHAKGKYLLFLNNDTKVHDFWMDELYNTFMNFSDVGLVGSKLVYSDGRLQEAGGIVWQDGSAWNYGRLQNANHPEYNYARTVDYCSGASILLSKKLFFELGCFDEYYRPAYYEDTDIAMKVQQAGYSVIYQPCSVVTHYEGISSGTDTNQGIKSYQVINHKKFYSRWKSVLSYNEPNAINVIKAKDKGIKYRALIVDSCTPTPDKDSGSIDLFNIMVILKNMGFHISFIPDDNFLYMDQYTKSIQSIGVHAIYSPYFSSLKGYLDSEEGKFDLVFLFRPQIANKHISLVREHSPSAKVIFHTVDLHFLRIERQANLAKELVEKEKILARAQNMRNMEYACMKISDMTTVVSDKERDLLLNLYPQLNVRHMPYSRAVMGAKNKFSARHGILFIGGYQHTPNIDAVKFFINDIMPLLRESLPDVKFYAAGSNTPDELIALASDDIVFLGFVENLAELMEEVRITVAPLRYGAGIKGKVGSALGFGVPTVATSIAVEGMELTAGEHIMVADDAKTFADKVFELYTNESIWRILQNNGLTVAEELWGASVAWKNLRDIIVSLGFKIDETPEKKFHLYQY